MAENGILTKYDDQFVKFQSNFKRTQLKSFGGICQAHGADFFPWFPTKIGELSDKIIFNYVPVAL